MFADSAAVDQVTVGAMGIPPVVESESRDEGWEGGMLFFGFPIHSPLPVFLGRV